MTQTILLSEVPQTLSFRVGIETQALWLQSPCGHILHHAASLGTSAVQDPRCCERGTDLSTPGVRHPGPFPTATERLSLNEVSPADPEKTNAMLIFNSQPPLGDRNRNGALCHMTRLSLNAVPPLEI